ncbi:MULTISPECIES: DUF4870 domain-containing protein [unclassified Flavobacterium]|jgi:hypothetical protein|uniref:DUF4870 domain-containing protein n=1 Tax=unclassified Flavobacterium TaxID=196869 RepID=UPI00057D2FBC|nr:MULTISPECIES: DUF4870 domain-containing protein [unclassified Flavobacterium]KIA92500.1 hypothetical protein OA93_23165 [Flavobacterium sp. KMS]KIC02257.1 hypothetical protein OA88_09610 [Flavobacterium sp. JRM]MEA9415267.1 DUF4870 domain-containing protein [Flavobacterium sp. PL02]OUL60023.1 hypothetical protein B8T70_22525 [Flavobacterium sp. AJR]
MTALNKFNYKPYDSELERASNSYLMSLVAVLGGLPLPIMNLLASVFFYLGNRKSTAFVKWHCTQALLAQLGMFFFNTVGFWWTISIVFKEGQFTNTYIAYMLTIIGFNLVEFIFTLYLASQTRKGNHIEIYFFADITNLICKTNENTI